MDPEEALKGGNRSQVTRRGGCVYRTAGPWTPRTQALLAHLLSAGIREVPEPLGIDAQGREMLSFLPGVAGNDPLPPALRAPALLEQAARLLRRLHDAAPAGRFPLEGWQVPARAPSEVICHGDFAPYNCIYQGQTLSGVIDFDYAHPGPRAWDLAYALYRFAPLAAPTNPDGYGDMPAQLRRARRFLDAYGVEERAGMLDWLERRLEGLLAMLVDGAAQGDSRCLANIQDGHHTIYQNDLAYLRQNRAEWVQVIER